MKSAQQCPYEYRPVGSDVTYYCVLDRSHHPATPHRDEHGDWDDAHEIAPEPEDADGVAVPRKVLQDLFDIVLNSMDFGSGFLEGEQQDAVRAVAVILGVDPTIATQHKDRCAFRGSHAWGPWRAATYDAVGSRVYRTCGDCQNMQKDDVDPKDRCPARNSTTRGGGPVPDGSQGRQCAFRKGHEGEHIDVLNRGWA